MPKALSRQHRDPDNLGDAYRQKTTLAYCCIMMACFDASYHSDAANLDAMGSRL